MSFDLVNNTVSGAIGLDAHLGLLCRTVRWTRPESIESNALTSDSPPSRPPPAD